MIPMPTPSRGHATLRFSALAPRASHLFRRVEDAVEPCAVFGERVLGLGDEGLWAGVAKQVRELGEFAFVFGQFVPAG